MGIQNPIAETEIRPDAASHPEDPWAEIWGIPCVLSVNLRIRNFKVRDLLALDEATVLDSQCNSISPVPIVVNGVVIGAGEFDVVNGRLAIRINEIG